MDAFNSQLFQFVWVLYTVHTAYCDTVSLRLRGRTPVHEE